MSWQQQLLRGLSRHTSSCASIRSQPLAALAGSSIRTRASPSSSPPSSLAAACFSQASCPGAGRARSVPSSLPFSAAALLQQARRSSGQPSFPPPPPSQPMSTSSSSADAVGGAGSGEAAAAGLVSEDDDDTLEEAPRRLARKKEPPDPWSDEHPSKLDENNDFDTIPDNIILGTSPSDTDRIFFIDQSRRLQRPLSHGAAAHIHHLVRVRESKEGGLPSARVGKEGLKRSFLASIGDQLQAHGVVKVSVPRSTGMEPGFVGFCLEGNQDCLVLGMKGNTITVYRDPSLPRPPSTYVDFDTAHMEQQPQQQWSKNTAVLHQNTEQELLVLRQLGVALPQQQAKGDVHLRGFSKQEHETLPEMKQLDDIDEDEAEGKQIADGKGGMRGAVSSGKSKSSKSSKEQPLPPNRALVGKSAANATVTDGAKLGRSSSSSRQPLPPSYAGKGKNVISKQRSATDAAEEMEHAVMGGVAARSGGRRKGALVGLPKKPFKFNLGSLML